MFCNLGLCGIPAADSAPLVVCHIHPPDLWPASSWLQLQHQTFAQLDTKTVNRF